MGLNEQSPFIRIGIAWVLLTCIVGCNEDGGVVDLSHQVDAAPNTPNEVGTFEDGEAPLQESIDATSTVTIDMGRLLNTDASPLEMSDEVSPADGMNGEPSPCQIACERVVGCAIDLCDGFDESSMERLTVRCLGICTPAIARILTNRSCDRVIRLVRQQDAEVDAACTPRADDGLEALYIGHSFGQPFASKLTQFAENMGIDNHTQRIFFSSGDSGAPEALWSNQSKRAQIQSILDGGHIDVLTMICCSADFEETGMDFGIINWMDYALAQNPNTRITLALPWPDFPRDFATHVEFSERWWFGNTLWDALIDTLRINYPNVLIQSIPHGRAALELRYRFEMGTLPEVSMMTGSNADSIFTDQKGHAGAILKDLGTLVWLGVMYDIDLSTYSFGSAYETDLVDIALTILESANDSPQ